MENNEKNQDARYLLAALIEIYRGNSVFLPDFDPEMENILLRDVFSSAISFAQNDESRFTLSDEINKSANEGVTVKEQVELAKIQTPDVLNAKMIAAAHVLKLIDNRQFMLS
jgi:hypothetical protein